ncbi:hypothetical protein [Novipirellula sp.]
MTNESNALELANFEDRDSKFARHLTSHEVAKGCSLGREPEERR